MSSDDSVNSPTSSNLLARLDKDDLKLIKVAIRRHTISNTFDPQPIQRSLDDPSKLVIHRNGEGQRPIFQRKDIVINKEVHAEERTILKSPRHGGFRRSRSKSSESSRSRSRSEKVDSFKDEDTDDKQKLQKQDDPNKKNYSRKRSRSRSPTDYRGSYKRRDSRSPFGQRKRSPPLRLGEYRPPKYRTPQYKDSSPSHRHEKSPDVYNRERREKERSPYYRRSNYRRRESRSRSPPRKYKRTPERDDGRSYRRRSPSKKDSPKRTSYRNSPERREDRKRTTYRHSRNRSRSPDHRGMHREMHHEYLPYYGGEEYWFPSPFSHPGFIPRGFVPPMVRGVPFPFAQPMFRPRPPIVYNQPYRPRIYPCTTPATAVQSTNSSAETTVMTNSTSELKTEEISKTVSSNDFDNQREKAQDQDSNGKL